MTSPRALWVTIPCDGRLVPHQGTAGLTGSDRTDAALMSVDLVDIAASVRSPLSLRIRGSARLGRMLRLCAGVVLREALRRSRLRSLHSLEVA